MPEAFTTRSGRQVKNPSHNQKKADALEMIARRRRGEKIDWSVTEEEPLYDEINEDEYNKTKRGGFVVDEDGEEIDDSSDDSFIDDSQDDRSYNSKGKAKSKRHDSKHERNSSNQRSVKSFFGKSSSSKQSGSSLKTPSFAKDDPKAEVNEDDILTQMLFSVPEDASSSVQKRTRVLDDKLCSKANTFSQQSFSKTLKTKAEYEPIATKRPRKYSPEPKYEPKDDLNDNLNTSHEIDYADLPHDDCFEDSHDDFPAMVKQSLNKVETLHSYQIQSSEDAETEKFNEDNLGIVGVPLNDDLKTNLEFFDLPNDSVYTRMYWYDCVEEQAKTPGTVYFFGRVLVTGAKRYVSCCTVVKNVKKTCYLLIKPDCTYDQAVFEFTNMFAKPLKFKNFTCQKATKRYAFSPDPDVPLEADYVQIDYSPNQPALPANLSGETFSKIFNLNQSPMEKMILDLKLRGPCWLRLVDPGAPNCNLTWSKIELIIESPEKLLVEPEGDKLKSPYFCAFSLSIRTFPNPVTHNNEIIAIAGMVNTSFNLDECLKRTNKASGHFCLMTKPPSGHKDLRLPFDFNMAIKGYNKTKFHLFDSERDLLQEFMNRFINLDPDIVVGHELLNFDYETLVMRMRALKLNIWSKLGRFRRTELPQTKAAFRYMFSGRVLCDIKMSAQELIKARSYDLTQLTLQTLGRNRKDYNHDSIIEAYKSSQTLIQMIHSTWEDNDSIFSILVELNIIPLALKITNITGNILSRTLAAGRSERNEYLLLHAFHEANFICPEKQLSNRFNKNNKFNTNNKKLPPNDCRAIADSTVEVGSDEATGPAASANPLRKKAAYAGGLVLEPKAGYYDSCILLMDFNSLYPSIIQEFNICFSTVCAPDLKDLEACPDAELIASVPSGSVEMGILPAQLKNLVDRRRAVKKLLADSKFQGQKLMLDIEQKALKLTANSMYGCLGFDQSRFYAKHLASLVTFKGREILMSTKAMVEKLGFEVIYGDTDSLMINTKIIDYDEVIQRGNTIKTEINSRFNLLEIDIDGVYRPLLLLKKKNYAGATIKKLADGSLSKEIETKGLDTVRRDRAVIAKLAGEKVLDMLLNGEKEIDLIVSDIHSYLKELGVKIMSGELGGEQFLITKQLNRNPDEYRDTKGLGHVVLALRHNNDSKNTRKLKAGDTVEYVICVDGTNESANQRAYTLQEVASSEGKLTLDYEYYLCQQIHPVMVRICDKLPTTNAYVLAEMLGVEKSSLIHIRREDCDADGKKDQLISRGAARFNSCPAIQIDCPNCGFQDKIVARSRKNAKTKKLEFSLSSCPECSIRYAMRSKHIVVQFIQLIRKLTTQVYTSTFICDNAECSHTTRNMFTNLAQLRGQDRPLCELCETIMTPDWDDRRMDLQLNYMRYLLNIERTQLEENEICIEPSDDLLDMYRQCLAQVDYALKTSSINNIDTNLVFSLICSGGRGGSKTVAKLGQGGDSKM